MVKSRQNSKTTTIKLSKETKERLDHVKEYKRETYDELLQKILEILNISKINPLRARARLIAIDRKKGIQQKRLIRIQRPIKEKPITSSSRKYSFPQ